MGNLILKNIVAEQHTKRIVADEFARQIDCVRQTELFILDDIIEVDAMRGAISTWA